MATFLSYGRVSETAELTGARQKPKQLEVLVRNGIPFIVGRDGWPRVALKTIEGRHTVEPDFSSLRG